MKRKEKMVGFILGIITGASVILSLGGLYLAKKDAAAGFHIGGGHAGSRRSDRNIYSGKD